MIQESATDGRVASVYRKVNLQLLPLLFFGFMFAYLDRINVGFAKLQMQNELALSDAAYGVGAGIFFVGYVLFEIPSNLLMPKVGARATFSRIMVLWGIASICMLFVKSVPAFYALRFLLGVFEAGFAPGVLFFLSRWYGPSRIAGAISIVWLAGPVSGILGGPLSTWIMTSFAGVGNLSGWQWMFLLEGAPCVVLGVIAFFFLPDGPTTASWLNPEEKRLLRGQLSEADGKHGSFRAVAKDPKVYILSLAYLCIISPIYALSFWLPTILNQEGITSTQQLGWYAAIPYVAAALAIFYGGRSSDKHGERRYHIALPVLIACLAIIAWVCSGGLLATIGFLTLATGMMWMANIVFWAVPPEYIKGDARAGAIALINTIGLSGGFWGPSIIGWSKSLTGSIHAGFLIMAAMLLIAGIIILFLRLNRQNAVDSASRSRASIPAGARGAE
ncbi:MFS transporter [Cupriavidus lacunae]|uniref:MFS transporter n=1 Tax=Cupriavidus lacunae TaxID=2666307 RepID=A0A370MYY5_9BURK|nr:MFS transporter [Cupriavidus lacunae]RDJ98417.1 MFS transporter [Cupriavidus lacunae]